MYKIQGLNSFTKDSKSSIHCPPSISYVYFCSLLFAGMSNSGKTTYIKTLLEQADKVFTENPSRIIYFYNVYQSKFSEMEASIPNKKFYQGLSQRSDIEKYADTEKHLLMVFDDLYQEVISSKDLCDLTIMLC